MASARRTVRAGLCSLIGILHTSSNACGTPTSHLHIIRGVHLSGFMSSLYEVNKEGWSVPVLSALAKLGWSEPVLERIFKIELSKL